MKQIENKGEVENARILAETLHKRWNKKHKATVRACLFAVLSNRSDMKLTQCDLCGIDIIYDDNVSKELFVKNIKNRCLWCVFVDKNSNKEQKALLIPSINKFIQDEMENMFTQ